MEFLIPPSIVFIIYGVLVEMFIGKLYLAGFVPGFLMTFIFMVLIAIQALREPKIAPKAARSNWAERLTGLTALIPIVFLMGMVLGTIYAGVATATEAAAFGVCGAFLIAALNRRLSISMLRETFLAAAGTTAMILFILIGAFVLQFVLAFLGLPAKISKWVVDMQLTKMQVL